MCVIQYATKTIDLYYVFNPAKSSRYQQMFGWVPVGCMSIPYVLPRTRSIQILVVTNVSCSHRCDTHKKRWLQVDLELEPLGDATATAPRFVSFKCFSTFFLLWYVVSCSKKCAVVHYSPSNRWCSFWSLGIVCGHGGTWIRYKTKSPGALPIRSLGCREAIARLLGGSNISLELPSQALPKKWCTHIFVTDLLANFTKEMLVLLGIFLNLTAGLGEKDKWPLRPLCLDWY